MGRCSFCGRKEGEVSLLLSGIDSYICNYCIEQAHTILTEENKKNSTFSVENVKLLKPKEIKEFLDQYVIGQHDAKISFCSSI